MDDLLKTTVEKALHHYKKSEVKILQSEVVHGGDSHHSFKLKTNAGSFFLKASANVPPDLFSKEREGLNMLKLQKEVSVAEAIHHGKAGNQYFLLMHFMETGSPQKDFWEKFAMGLAHLHRKTRPRFGLDDDNYLGRQLQSNTSKDSWPDFYITQRLQPFLKKCQDAGLMSNTHIREAESLFHKLDTLFPPEPPALLHGDLWGGNFLCGEDGYARIFDPAVYYGNREMDLAMTRLFGGFDRKFYWYYQDYFPLEPGWENRIALCQLYPLIIHALHFGGGYVHQVKRILKDFA